MEKYNTYNSSDYRVIKKGNSYLVTSSVMLKGSYSLVHNSCEGEVVIEQGVFSFIDTVALVLDLLKEGEYHLTLVDKYDKSVKITISHYPSIINRLVTSISNILCKDCSTEYLRPCITKEENSFLLYGQVYSQLQYFLNLIVPLKIGESSDILRDFITTIVRNDKCEFLFSFCKEELAYKIKGEKINACDDINLQYLGTCYLALYYYFYKISDSTTTKQVMLDFNYYTIRKCLLKLGLDLTKLELIFEELALEDTPFDVICQVNNIIPIKEPSIKIFNLPLNKDINDIYDYVELKNNGLDTTLVLNTTLLKRSNFLIQAKVSSIPLEVAAGKTFTTAILLSGKVATPETIDFIYKIDNTLINTYRLIFTDADGNRSPIITSIFKTIESGESYLFTLEDFDTHFIDLDGDYLETIAILGDTSCFFLKGKPYLSGTKIDRNNIASLEYRSLSSNEEKTIEVQWKAWDSANMENS